MHGVEQALGYVLAELGRIQQTQQNSAGVTDVADIADIAVETGRQNMAEYGRIWQNMADCRRLPQIAAIL